MDAALKDDYTPFRPLGEQERLLHYVHNMGGLLATLTLHVRGPLDEVLMRRGLAWLQQRHPMLNAHIAWRGFGLNAQAPWLHRKFWFDTRGTTEIPLRFTSDSFDAVLQKELKTRFPRRRNPRMRITVIREAPDLNRILLVCDHSIGDAMAALAAARDLMGFLGHPDAAPRPNDDRLPPPLEGRFTPSSDPRRRYLPARRLPQTRTGVRTGTHYEKRLLDQPASDALRAAVRRERTTLNGAVGAAVLQAAGAEYGRGTLTCLTNPELRKLMKPPLPQDTFGCYIDAVRTEHGLDQPFWALAREVSFKLVAAIATHQLQASTRSLPGIDWYLKEAAPMVLSGFCLDGVSVTTAGDTGFGRDYGQLVLEDITVVASLNPIGLGLYVVAVEFQGHVQLTLCYRAQDLEQPRVAAIADRVVAMLGDLPAG